MCTSFIYKTKPCSSMPPVSNLLESGEPAPAWIPVGVILQVTGPGPTGSWPPVIPRASLTVTVKRSPPGTTPRRGLHGKPSPITIEHGHSLSGHLTAWDRRGDIRRFPVSGPTIVSLHECNSLQAAMRHILALSVFVLDPLIENRKEQEMLRNGTTANTKK